MKITDLSNASGYWTATIDGVAVDRRFGSWRITPEGTRTYRAVRPQVAAELQELVRKAERRERAAC